MYKLRYYDYWGGIIKQDNEQVYKTQKQAWWTHYNRTPVTSFYTVEVIKI